MNRKLGLIFAAVAFASAIGTSGTAGIPMPTGPTPMQTQIAATTASLVRCDVPAMKACWGTCPFDTVENWEACRLQCEIDHCS
jgi:hypothetical protein